MKLQVAILAVAAVALAACDRPANTAYNNSGQSAATAPGPTTQSAASDTASPTVAATGDETGTSRRILTAIVSDPGMKDADVTVKTENGVVTLGGSAKSHDQVALATGIATKQPGVSRVESQIALN